MNLFSALFRWAKREEKEGSTPQENFLTDAFAAVLKYLSSLKKLDKFFGNLLKQDQLTLTPPVEIETQRKLQIDGGNEIIADILISTGSRETVVENKWYADVDENQVKSYFQWASTDPGKRRLLFITPRPTDKQKIEKTSRDGRAEWNHFTWHSVVSALKKIECKRSDNWLIQQFVKFCYVEELAMEKFDWKLFDSIGALRRLWKLAIYSLEECGGKAITGLSGTQNKEAPFYLRGQVGLGGNVRAYLLLTDSRDIIDCERVNEFLWLHIEKKEEVERFKQGFQSDESTVVLRCKWGGIAVGLDLGKSGAASMSEEKQIELLKSFFEQCKKALGEL